MTLIHIRSTAVILQLTKAKRTKTVSVTLRDGMLINCSYLNELETQLKTELEPKLELN